MTAPEVQIDIACYHCGQPCQEGIITFAEKNFCCQGCKTVFEVLADHDLCEYYSFETAPGIRQEESPEHDYAFLNEPAITKKLLLFNSASYARIQFKIPGIHCISCIWLLENLQRLGKGILKSEVNFSRRTVTIDFNPVEVSLAKLASILSSLGYAPSIKLEDGSEAKKKPTHHKLVIKLTLAGFCFGNVMLFSFPEYLGLDPGDALLRMVFSYLNLALALPVLLVSAQDYFSAALKSFRQKQINIDVPIAIGLAALFLRSAYDILTATGPGYMDSFTGLVFFLLIGRWFQGKTYESLAFDRDYKSYFPLTVQKSIDEEWKPVLVQELREKDTIRLRNMEILPADSTLLESEAFIDYSFVTGESRPVKATLGELIYAGGRLIGQPVILQVQKKISQSHLTSLWNHESFRKKEESRYKRMIDRAARRFTWIVLGITMLTAVYWYVAAPSQMWLVVTSVLMVACPCALALAAPFTFGNMLRSFGDNGFYLKNADVIERLAAVDALVFDKTGTVTHGSATVAWVGILEDEERGWVGQLTASSTHPLSTLITRSITITSHQKIEAYRELPGKGIEASIEGHRILVGSQMFVGVTDTSNDLSTRVYVKIDEEVRGFFSIGTAVRPGIKEMLLRVQSKCVALISGDNKGDSERMEGVFPSGSRLLFNQTPHDKLEVVRGLQQAGRKVMMVGDGLNDSGALKQSDVGIAVTDDTGVFTPACDGILMGNEINSLDYFLKLSRSSITILKISFVISFLYNAIGLGFAVSGHLTPLVAAVLMPVSSISVVIFTTLAVRYVSKNKKRR